MLSLNSSGRKENLRRWGALVGCSGLFKSCVMCNSSHCWARPTLLCRSFFCRPGLVCSTQLPCWAAASMASSTPGPSTGMEVCWGSSLWMLTRMGVLLWVPWPPMKMTGSSSQGTVKEWSRWGRTGASSAFELLCAACGPCLPPTPVGYWCHWRR